MAYNLTATSSQYFSTNSVPVSGMPITMSVWFNTPNATSTSARALVDMREVPNSNFYRLTIPGNSSVLRANQVTSGVSVNVDTTANFTTNNWMHGSAIFASPTSRSVFLNGSNKGTNTTSLAAPAINRLHIGGTFATAAGAFMTGLVAEVGIWNAALTDDEIASLAKGMTCDKIRPQNLVFYAPLIRNLQDVKGGLTITNNNSAIVANHPRIYS